MRYRNTTVSGGSFDPSIINAVWNKGRAIAGHDPNVERIDACGALIRKAAYGMQTNSGWEIDHITPVAANGTDALSNLQPLQWENNRHKSDKLQWSCAVSAR